ncbi:MAG TPA: TIGR00725 family protein [Mycobacteriales bacterium]|nr:TIGR00725 family protein [Mycobacteriales bacterium]
MRRHIAVVGPSVATAEELDWAYETGRAIAERGDVLVTGGLGGVMAAACRGASEAGGVSVGLLPGSDRSEANPHVTVAIATGLGELRNGLVVRSADGVIAIGGSWGTLSEIALAVRTGTPLVVLGGWELRGGDSEPLDLLRANTPTEALAILDGH